MAEDEEKYEFWYFEQVVGPDGQQTK